MSRKANLIRMLLCSYPGRWRSEYGGELALTLARRPITVSIVVDVVRSGTWQRVRRAEPWQLGGFAMAVWMVFGTALNSITPLSPRAYGFFFQVNLWITLVVGYLSVWRNGKGLISAARASAKANFMGLIPELLLTILWAVGLIHPTVLDMSGSPRIIGHGITELCVRSEAMVTPASLFVQLSIVPLLASIVGLIGGVLARTISSFRNSIRKA
jgi:hypothetical protein